MSPVRWQPIPKPRQVTTIVCAISGVLLSSKSTSSNLKSEFYQKVIPSK
jgi:hypothetical protein